MGPLYLLGLASSQARWLELRQSTISANVANANTPGFKALDVQPFEMAMEQARLTMAATKPGHMAGADANAPAPGVRKDETWDVTHTGNSVSLEQELIKAGDVNRAYRLNTSVAKAFHRMILASAKV